MRTPQFSLDRWWWLPERSGERGEHVLPDAFFDLLPEWPLDTNRPAGVGFGKSHRGMNDACYLNYLEAMTAADIAHQLLHDHEGDLLVHPLVAKFLDERAGDHGK